jgi:hypothetical protein
MLLNATFNLSAQPLLLKVKEEVGLSRSGGKGPVGFAVER